MKAIFTIIFLFLLVIDGQSMNDDHYTVFIDGDKKGIVNQFGEVIIPAKYDDLGWTKGSERFVNNVIGYNKDGKWGIISIENKIITSAKYYTIESRGEYIIVSQKPRLNSPIKYGVVTNKGKLLIPFVYPELEIYGNRVVARDNSGYGLLNLNNKDLLPFIYQRIDSIAFNKFAVHDQKGKVSIVDENGNSNLKYSIDSISALTGKFYFIYKDGKTGLLSSGGFQIYPPEYKKIKVENANISLLTFNHWKVITQNDQRVMEFNFDDIEALFQDLYLVKINNQYRIYNHASEEAKLSPPFDLIEPLNERFFRVENGGHTGVINRDGQLIIPLTSDSLFYKKGLIYTKQLGEWHLYDTLGIKKNTFEYSRILPGNEDRYPILRNGKWGFMNRKGEEVIYPVYDQVSLFKNGLSIVEFHSEFGIIDREGKWVVYPSPSEDMEWINDNTYLIHSSTQSQVKTIDDRLIYFTRNELQNENGLLLEKLSNGLWNMISYDGVILGRSFSERPSFVSNNNILLVKDSASVGAITKSGEFIIPLGSYSNILSYSEEFWGIEKDGYYGFVDNDNKLRIANRYNGIGPFSEGLAAFKLNGKWGFIDKREQIIVQPYYTRVSDFRNGVSIITQNDLHGLMGSDGKIIQPLEFEMIEMTDEGYYILMRNDKYGIADEHGTILIYPQFSLMKDLPGTQFLAGKNDKMGVIDQYGKTIIPFEYEELTYDRDIKSYIAKDRGSWKTTSYQSGLE